MSFLLYLPVELKVREFDSRLLLAAVALTRGWSVVLGARMNQNHRLFCELPKSIVVAKSGMASELAKIAAYQERGHIYGVMDEEGFVIPDPVFHAERRYPESVRARVDFSLLWGRREQEVLGIDDRDPKHFVTGNPRVDLWRNEGVGLYDEKVREIRAAHGNFLLIPSNFSACLRSDEETERRVRQGFLPEDQERVLAFRREIQAPMKVAFLAFRDAMEELGKAGHHIVFRPHPADDLKIVKSYVEGLPNVSICGEGPITPWVMASRGIIHWSCTTALEATLLRRPVIQYCPPIELESAQLLDRLGVGSVGFKVASFAELADSIARCVDGSEFEDRAAVAGVMQHAHVEDRMASELIMDRIESMCEPGRAEMRPVGWHDTLRESAKRIVRPPKALSISDKFPDTSEREVKRSLATIMAHLRVGVDYRCRKVGKNLFHIEPN